MEVSKKAVARESCHTADGSGVREQPDEDVRRGIMDTPGTWTAFQVVQPLPWSLTQVYGFVVTARIAAWLTEALQTATMEIEPCRWVSVHQLYLDYQLATGDIGPIYERGWVDTQKRPYLLTQLSFQKLKFLVLETAQESGSSQSWQLRCSCGSAAFYGVCTSHC